MFSTPKKLLLIGLTALVPTIAQATLIDKTPHGGKTYAGQLAQTKYKFNFSATGKPRELPGSWKNSPRRDAKQRRQDVNAFKEICHSLNSNKNSRFEFNPKHKSKHLKGLTKGKRYDERSISVPEPGTAALIALGLAGLGMSRRSEQQHRK